MRLWRPVDMETRESRQERGDDARSVAIERDEMTGAPERAPVCLMRSPVTRGSTRQTIPSRIPRHAVAPASFNRANTPRIYLTVRQLDPLPLRCINSNFLALSILLKSSSWDSRWRTAMPPRRIRAVNQSFVLKLFMRAASRTAQHKTIVKST